MSFPPRALARASQTIAVKCLPLLLASVLLAGCGQKGELYLPDGDQPVVRESDLPGEETRLDRSGDLPEEDPSVLQAAPGVEPEEDDDEDDDSAPPPVGLPTDP